MVCSFQQTCFLGKSLSGLRAVHLVRFSPKVPWLRPLGSWRRPMAPSGRMARSVSWCGAPRLSHVSSSRDDTGLMVVISGQGGQDELDPSVASAPDPHGEVRPFHQESACLTQSTLGPYVVQI
jgi:hypothetical protein